MLFVNQSSAKKKNLWTSLQIKLIYLII